jgi:hypothetical protein
VYEQLGDNKATPENAQDIPVDMMQEPYGRKDSKEQDYPDADPGDQEFVAMERDYRHIGDDEYGKADYLRRCHPVFSYSG